MMEKCIVIGAGIILFLLIGANFSYADGFIIPIPPPDVVRVPPLTIKYHRVSVEITDQVVTTKVDQVFINDFHRDLEGTYIFPLPKGANITEFAMYMDGERVTAELLEREKARRIYQSIVDRMKDPALLEYMDRDLFKIRVYPIPAHGEKRIQLEYSEVLKNDAGLVRYYYPLDTERFSARPLQEISIYVTLHAQDALKSIYAPSHAVVIDRKGDHKATISYEDTRVLPDKDFILYYSLSNADFGANLLTYKKTRPDGYFMLMVSPGYELDQHQVIPKDIVFVLDTSGSMRRDKKMEQAQDALIYGLRGLNAEDRFGVVTFSTTVNSFDEVLLKGAEQHIDEAVEFVKELRARGGTDIHEALQTALTLIDASSDSSPTRPRIIVFLTDGRPTVGITEYQDIVKKAGKKNRQQNRIFTFGVGYDVNTHLLDTLSEQSKAASAYIEPSEDLEVIVSAFFDKIDSPVLSDLDLKLSGAGTYDVFPKELPDLFKGSQLLVVGRYRNPGEYRLVLSGLVDEKDTVFEYNVDLPHSDRSNDFLPRIWASRKVGYLLDQIRLHGEDRELKEEVIELAKKFGIVTPYTSYLVAEDEEFGEHYSRTSGRRTRNMLGAIPAPSAEPNYDRSRPEAPRGVARELYQLKESKDLPSAGSLRGVQEGKEAVIVSKNVNKLKRQDVVTDSFSSEIRYVGSKTFYLIDETWIDSEYVEGQPALKIKYGSAAYFQLLDELPEIGKYFSLGKNLIICWEEDICLKIGSAGISEADDQELSNMLPEQ